MTSELQHQCALTGNVEPITANVSCTLDKGHVLLTYHYRLTSMGESSAKYGPCEVCKQPVSEVFLQAKSRGPEYVSTSTTFGHKECLEALQK